MNLREEIAKMIAVNDTGICCWKSWEDVGRHQITFLELADQILNHPTISKLLKKLEQADGDLDGVVVLDEDQEFPERHIYPPEMTLISFMSDLRKQNWVKILPQGKSQ